MIEATTWGWDRNEFLCMLLLLVAIPLLVLRQSLKSSFEQAAKLFKVITQKGERLQERAPGKIQMDKQVIKCTIFSLFQHFTEEVTSSYYPVKEEF